MMAVVSLPGKIIIKDGCGTNEFARVKENTLYTQPSSHPPYHEIQKTKVFRQYATDDGLTTGNKALNVDGSTTTQKFYIKADNDDDIYLTQINIAVAYGGASILNHWCDSGAVLTNGIRFYYIDCELEEIDIHDAIKSNGNLIRMGVTNVISGWELRSVAAANDYGYIVTIPLKDYMPPYGIKLRHGSSQQLIISIRDDNRAVTTGCDHMNAIVYGFKRFF